MKNFFKIIFVCLVVFGLIQVPAMAQEEVNPYQVFLPLIAKEEYSNPWIGPDGGYVVNMVTNPLNGLIMYAGTWGNGVFKSVDGGKTWAKSSNGLGDFWINSMAIDPINPLIVYAGTYNDEIYKSTDGGENWYHSSDGIQDHSVIYTIAIDPYNTDIIYIGTRDLDVPDYPFEGVLYRSTNEGISWTPVLKNVGDPDLHDWAYDIVVNPKDHCMVFAAMHLSGAYRSTNCGDTWSSLYGNGLNDNSGRALVIKPSGTSNDGLYLGTWHRNGVYKSTDNGITWIQEPLNAKIYNMDMDLEQPKVIYVAAYLYLDYDYGGIIKTTDAGLTWSYMGLASNLMYTVMVNPTIHTQIFAGTAGNGIFRSDQSGSGWTHSQAGLNNSKVTGFQVSPTSSDQLFASISRAGFNYSSDGGKSWQQLNSGLTDLDASGIVLNPQNPDQVYLLTTTGGLFTCNISNCSWTKKNVGLPSASADTSIYGFIPQNELENEIIETMPLEEISSTKSTISSTTIYQTLNDMDFSLSNSAYVYLATNANGVYKSTNATESWSQAGLSGKNILKVAINPTNAQIIYASQSGTANVYTSTNAGGSWSSSLVPGGNVNDLSTSPSNPGIVYAATNNGVYMKPDGGSWQLVGLSGKTVTAFAVHPNESNLMVAGCGGEVFYSKDGGLNWFEGTKDLITTSIKKVTFDHSNFNLVYLGTITQGTYRLKIN